MTAGNRFKGWVETSARGWSSGVADWLWGITVRLIIYTMTNFIAKFRTEIVASMETLRDAEDTPPEVRAFLRDVVIPEGAPGEYAGSVFTVLGAVTALMQVGQPAGKIYSYWQDKLIKSSRLDPLSVIAAWRRDPESYNKYFDDLREQGWSDDRIEALKFITREFPSLRDVIGFYAHEVFEPDMIARYGLSDETPPYEGTLFEKLGVPKEIADMYWMDHWEHASWTQVTEMLHRGQLTDEDVWEWFRLVEIPPYWRDKLIATSWGIPNRIEIRMMARYLDMSKEEIMELLKKAGLSAEFRADAADFMIIMGLTGYWADLLRNNWIGPDQLKTEIESHGLKPVTADRIYKSLVKYVGPERVAKEKDLTAAEIIRGVKKEVIDIPQGIELLMDLGYDEWEATFKIAIDVAVATGSPETYEEFKDITNKYRRARGMETKPVPEEIKAAGAAVVKVTAEVKALERAVKEERGMLTAEEEVPDSASAKLVELQVALNRARAELQRLELDYHAKVAAWKHGE